MKYEDCYGHGWSEALRFLLLFFILFVYVYAYMFIETVVMDVFSGFALMYKFENW